MNKNFKSNDFDVFTNDNGSIIKINKNRNIFIMEDLLIPHDYCHNKYLLSEAIGLTMADIRNSENRFMNIINMDVYTVYRNSIEQKTKELVPIDYRVIAYEVIQAFQQWQEYLHDNVEKKKEIYDYISLFIDKFNNFFSTIDIVFRKIVFDTTCKYALDVETICTCVISILLELVDEYEEIKNANCISKAIEIVENGILRSLDINNNDRYIIIRCLAIIYVREKIIKIDNNNWWYKRSK